MDFDRCRSDLPILLIHNLDPSWPSQEIQDYRAETRQLIDALIEVGHIVQEVCVQSADLEMALEGFNPDEYIIFNELHQPALVEEFIDGRAGCKP